MLEPVFLGNDYEVEYTLTEVVQATGKRQPMTGLTDLYAWLSLTDAGSEVHADVKVQLTERTSKLGTYFGVINGAHIDTRLRVTMENGQDWVYVVMKDTGNVATSNKVPLREPRRAN